MSSREQFEAWLASEYQWANDTLNEAHFHGDDETGYYTGGDFIYDGKSCSDALFWAWRGWQESHQQGEAKCAALAAELKQSQIDAGCYKKGMEASNERLIQIAAELSAVEAIHNESVFITDDHYEQCPKEVQKIIRSLAVMQIPAYKAFLAEVRAQGAEGCIRQLVISDDDDFSDAPNVCAMVAHQLRKGVQS